MSSSSNGWFPVEKEGARIRYASRWPLKQVRKTHLRPCYQLVLFVDAHDNIKLGCYFLVFRAVELSARYQKFAETIQNIRFY